MGYNFWQWKMVQTAIQLEAGVPILQQLFFTNHYDGGSILHV